MKQKNLKLIQNSTYRIWLIATTSDRYGGAVQGLALMLLTYSLTGSAASAGLMVTVRMLLSYAVAAAGGVIVDRYDRRGLMLLRAVLNGCVWGLFSILVFLGMMNFSLMLVFVSVGTILGGLIGGAGEAALRSLLDREEFAKASAINQARDASAEILGGPVAGFLFALSQVYPWVVSTFGYVVLGVAALFLPPLPPEAERSSESRNSAMPDTEEILGRGESITNENIQQKASNKDKVKEFLVKSVAGFRWIFSIKQMTALTLVSLFLNLSGFLVLTAFELNMLSQGVSSVRIGFLTTVEALGVIVGAVLVGPLIERVATGKLIILVHIIDILAFSVALLNQDYYYLLISCALYALLIPVTSASVGAYIFGLVPPNMQGRVDAANTFLIGIPVALTGVAAGAFVSSVGMLPVVVVSITLCCVALLLCLSNEDIRSIPVPADWPDKLEVNI